MARNSASIPGNFAQNRSFGCRGCMIGVVSQSTGKATYTTSCNSSDSVTQLLPDQRLFELVALSDNENKRIDRKSMCLLTLSQDCSCIHGEGNCRSYCSTPLHLCPVIFVAYPTTIIGWCVERLFSWPKLCAMTIVVIYK